MIADFVDCCIPKSLSQNSSICLLSHTCATIMLHWTCLLLRCHLVYCSCKFRISDAMESIMQDGYAIAPVTNRVSFEFTRIVCCRFTALPFTISRRQGAHLWPHQVALDHRVSIQSCQFIPISSCCCGRLFAWSASVSSFTILRICIEII